MELLETKGLAFKPDLVVLMFLANDYININSSMVFVGFWQSKFFEFLFAHSRLIRWLSQRVRLIHYNHYKSLGEDNVESGLARLRELADTHGFEVLIAIWPRFTGEKIYNPPEHFVGMDSGKMRIEEKASRYKFKTLKLSDNFVEHNLARIKAGDSTIAQAYYAPDQIHPSAKAAKIVAKFLYKEVCRHSKTLKNSSINFCKKK